MTTSQLADLSDVFNPTIVKPLLANVFVDLHHNSVFSRMIDEMMPKGWAVANFGRITTARLKETKWNKIANTKDGACRYGRLMDTDDNITVRVTLLRKNKWDNSAYVFDNRFSLVIEFIDQRLKNQRFIKSDLHTLRYVSREYTYDPRVEFEYFVTRTLGDDFNNNAQVILDSFERHKVNCRGINKATGRY